MLIFFGIYKKFRGMGVWGKAPLFKGAFPPERSIKKMAIILSITQENWECSSSVLPRQDFDLALQSRQPLVEFVQPLKLFQDRQLLFFQEQKIAKHAAKQ